MSDLTEITSNIETVLGTTLGWNLEDLSDVDQLNSDDWSDEILCQLIFEGLERELNIKNSAPKWSIASFNIRIVFKDTSPSNYRTRSMNIHDSLLTSLTAAAIDLTDKNVQYVANNEEQSSIEYDPPFTIINYPIKVRYGYTS